MFKGPSALSDKQASVVVAEVNGEAITYKDFFNQLYPYFQQTSYSFGITQDNINSEANKEIIRSFKTDVLDSVIKQRLAVQKAAEQGLHCRMNILRATDQMITAVSQELQSTDTSENTDKDYEAMKTIEAEAATYGMTAASTIKNMLNICLLQIFLTILQKMLRLQMRILKIL